MASNFNSVESAASNSRVMRSSTWPVMYSLELFANLASFLPLHCSSLIELSVLSFPFALLQLRLIYSGCLRSLSCGERTLLVFQVLHYSSPCCCLLSLWLAHAFRAKPCLWCPLGRNLGRSQALAKCDWSHWPTDPSLPASERKVEDYVRESSARKSMAMVSLSLWPPRQSRSDGCRWFLS